jgi:hypothetical protein
LDVDGREPGIFIFDPIGGHFGTESILENFFIAGATHDVLFNPAPFVIALITETITNGGPEFIFRFFVDVIDGFVRVNFVVGLGDFAEGVNGETGFRVFPFFVRRAIHDFFLLYNNIIKKKEWQQMLIFRDHQDKI